MESLFVFGGLAFKPNTDDLRKSSAIEIMKTFQKAGHKIQAYDPVAIGNPRRELQRKNIGFCKSAFESAKNSNILALVTQWSGFLQIYMKKVSKFNASLLLFSWTKSI
jgi:UDPglucose 6-dehydrogenase